MSLACKSMSLTDHAQLSTGTIQIPLESSIRSLPHIIMGASINILTGYLASRIQVCTLVVASALVPIVASPISAPIQVHVSYWLTAFGALLLSPVNPDDTLNMKTFLAPLIKPHCVKPRRIQSPLTKYPLPCQWRIQRDHPIRKLSWFGHDRYNSGISD